MNRPGASRAARADEAPAGFWHRYAAWSLDWILLGTLIGVLVIPLLARAWSQLLALYGVLEDWVYQRVLSSNGVPSPLAMSQEVLLDPALRSAAEQGVAALSSTIVSISLLVFALSAFYFVIAEAGWGATPGKRLLGLRVRRLDGGDVGFVRALLRHLAGALSWMLLNLGHAIAAWRRDKRALHDLLAGTRVVALAPMPPWARGWLWLQGLALAALFIASLAYIGWQMFQLSQL